MEIVIKASMTEEEAIAVAKQLTKVRTLLKFYLGRLWNAVDQSTKVILCDKFGYQPSTMRGLGAVVNKYPPNFEKEFAGDPLVTFGHYDFAARSADPVATLRDAVERRLSCKEVLALAVQNTKDMAKVLKDEKEAKVTQLPYEEPSSEFEYSENAEVTKGRSLVRITPSDVFSFFGLIPTKMTKEVYGILYRHSSKAVHPDVTGDDEEFLEFSRCAEYLAKYITD